mmetsp:Transcript_18288/g.30905  ORF Transcript_18288/g.30905 Transcript_18288/m.30905 type:complete len:113 (+) Transcript_18288:622-960(+)
MDQPPIMLLSSQYLGPYDTNSSSPASISLCAIAGQCQIPGSLMCSYLTLHLSSILGSLITVPIRICKGERPQSHALANRFVTSTRMLYSVIASAIDNDDDSQYSDKLPFPWE